LAAATQRGSELQQELGLTRERLDRAERMAAQFEEISEAAQSAIDALRARLGQAETERGELLEERERIAAERDRFAKERDQIVEDRIWVAKDRDRIAAERDRIAEERDRLRSAAERLAEERDRLHLAADELARERDEVGEAAARWFDAAVLAPADRLAGRRQSRGWRIGKYVVTIGRRRGRGSPMGRADKARDAGQWERAACSYLEALEQVGPRPAILVQLGHVLKEAGKAAAAEIAYRRAADLDKTNVDAFVPLAQLLCRRERYEEATQVFQQALEHCTHPEKRAYISGELASLRPLADPSPAATAAES
jgi:tetratricopeptide (TPR) repeat protein